MKSRRDNKSAYVILFFLFFLRRINGQYFSLFVSFCCLFFVFIEGESGNFSIKEFLIFFVCGVGVWVSFRICMFRIFVVLVLFEVFYVGKGRFIFSGVLQSFRIMSICYIKVLFIWVINFFRKFQGSFSEILKFQGKIL